MKRCTLLVIFLGLIASRAVMADVCAGAEGASKACAPECSGQVVNEEVTASNGKFNVGGGNQGDGNDGFNNQGNFNIGSGNKGNCNLVSGGTVGSCDVGNNNGRIVLRFCNVYPSDPKCQPSGYLPEYTDGLKSAVQAVVSSCNGGPPAPVLPPVVPAPSTAPGAEPTTPSGSTPEALPGLSQAPSSFVKVSDSKADPLTLLKLLAEHIKQEKAAGRKLLL